MANITDSITCPICNWDAPDSLSVVVQNPNNVVPCEQCGTNIRFLLEDCIPNNEEYTIVYSTDVELPYD